jgi:ParB family chromosome partitioning protein
MVNKAKPPVKKVKLDYAASTAALVKASSASADNRWEAALRITQDRPTALSPVGAAPLAPADIVEPKNALAASSLRVGQVYELAIGLIDSNPYGARFFYRNDNIDKVGTSMGEDSQLVPVNGFVNGDRVELYDGETRLRSARSTGKPTLLVKIDAPPADALDQHRRSSLFNSVRSNHSHLDVAVRLKQFIEKGIYANQEEVAKKYLDDQGQPIGSQRASMYMRIANIPLPFLNLMSEKDNTSTFTAAYEIGALFHSDQFKADPGKIGDVAREVIKEIQDNELSTAQVKALVKSKLDGPQSRLRAESLPVKFSGTKGVLKVFPSRGQLDLSFKGLPEDKLAELRQSVEKMLAGRMEI